MPRIAVTGLRASIVIAAVGLGAAIALIAAGWNRAPTSMELVGAELGGRIADGVQTVATRADAIAHLHRIAWAVATDEATMLDLTASELAFSAQPGELVGVAQIERRSGQVTWLWRAGRHLDLPPPTHGSGLHAMIEDGELIVFAVAQVVPEARRDELDGAVVVARGFDLDAVRRQMVASGLSARLDAGGGSLVLGQAMPGARAYALRLADNAPAELQASIFAPPAGPSPLSLAVASLVLALALGAAVLLAWRRQRGPSVAELGYTTDRVPRI